MADIKKSTTGFTDEAFEISEAFAKSLQALDEVSCEHLTSVANIAESIMQAAAKIDLEAVGAAKKKGRTGKSSKAAKIDKTAAQAIAKTQKARNVASKNTEAVIKQGLSSKGKVIDTALEAEAAKQLSNAYANAVQNQQQINVIAEAMLSTGIATLFNLDTATLGDLSKRILSSPTGL